MGRRSEEGRFEKAASGSRNTNSLGKPHTSAKYCTEEKRGIIVNVRMRKSIFWGRVVNLRVFSLNPGYTCTAEP